MPNEEMRARMLVWLDELSEKQFAEFFYEAVANRSTADTKESTGHFVLADVEKFPGEPWEIDFIAVPTSGEQWVDDAPICQWGQCSGCGSNVRSWAKRMRCPVCGEDAYGT